MSNRFSGRAVLAATFAAMLGMAGAGQAAQPYPSRPIRLIAPIPPGGSGDLVARLLANAASQQLKQQIVVENKPGATGNIGTAQAAKAPADGYTLVQCSIGTCAISPSLYANPGYDLFKDFAPVILLGSSINVLTVNKDTGITSLKQLLEQSSTRRLAYGSSGVGASNHLAGELLKKVAGVDLLHVPYKGSGPAITDLLGGQIQVFFDNEPSILPFIKSDKVRALAVTGKKRSSNLPDVPTMEELGYAGFVIEPWYAVAAPAATPPDVIATLNAAFNRGLVDPVVRQTLLDAGITPSGGEPAVLGKLMRSEYERWGELIKSQNIKGD